MVGTKEVTLKSVGNVDSPRTTNYHPTTDNHDLRHLHQHLSLKGDHLNQELHDRRTRQPARAVMICPAAETRRAETRLPEGQAL